MTQVVPSVVPVVVIDTNVVLDMFVFRDPRVQGLMDDLAMGRQRWIATQRMRDELERVLHYPHVLQRLQAAADSQANALSVEAVLAQRDAWAQLVDVAPKAPYTCKDPDDQCFIDLAVAHTCPLWSKDKAVLKMRKRLAGLGVEIR